MPLVNDASHLPCVIWKSENGWNLDYINLTQDQAESYLKKIRHKDPGALLVKGAEFSRGSYPFVYDEIITERLWAEYNSLGDNQSDELFSIVDFVDDSMSGLSSKAADYIVSLKNPLTELNNIYLSCLKNDNLNSKVLDSLIEQIESRAEIPIKENQENIVEPVQFTAYFTTGIKNMQMIPIDFPTTTEKLYAALKTDNIKDFKINGVSCESLPSLGQYIAYPGNDTNINELQYISTLISCLTQDERETISAFLEVCHTEEPITVKNVMDAIENLDTFSLDTTIKTEEDIGSRRLDEAVENCQPAIDKLSNSTEQSDRNFLQFVQLLNDNFDVASYGRRLCEENDMYPSSKGVISVDWRAFDLRDDRQVPNSFNLIDKTKSSILRQVEKNKAKISQETSPDKQKKKENIIE